MREGFFIGPGSNTLELFFRVCRRYKIDDEAGRTALLRELVRRNKAAYIRDAGEFMKGKKVWHIKKDGQK